jgi:hypothetical protein
VAAVVVVVGVGVIKKVTELAHHVRRRSSHMRCPVLAPRLMAILLLTLTLTIVAACSGPTAPAQQPAGATHTDDPERGSGGY